MGPLRDPGTCRWHFTKWSINKKFISIILCGGSFKFLIIVLLSDWPVLGGVSVPDCLGEPNYLHWGETRIDKSGQWEVSFIYPGWKEIREKVGVMRGGQIVRKARRIKFPAQLYCRGVLRRKIKIFRRSPDSDVSAWISDDVVRNGWGRRLSATSKK